MTSRLTTLWTQHIRDDKQKEEFKGYVRNSIPLLERLRDIIEAEELSIYREEASEKDYSEGWQFLQAHRNGRKEALQFLKKLTDHVNEK